MAADRDLLFGLLALQNGLIDQGQLVAAFQAWTREKARPLAEHLVGRGVLDADARSGVEAMVALHLKKHGGDAERSLGSLPVGRSTRERIEALEDPDLTVTVARVCSGPTEPGAEAMTTSSVGPTSADGQRFRLLRPHARGGLGAVFVALDGELNREVALKQILDHHADDATSRERFLIEAEITGGLEHPGIVPVYGLGAYADGRPYYAMRFIRGDSLKDAIERFHADESFKADPGRRSLELRRLLRRFLDVCNAIDYAHSRGVLHRDIKPGNVIVGTHGETLVVDWGLAKAQGKGDAIDPTGERPLVPSSASGSAETLPGSALGTPAYMSPEQARGELDALGPRSDVYSLGATLYALLTGKAPFEGTDLGAVLEAVRAGRFPRPRQLDPGLDAPLEAICLKAMATRAEGRYPSARALADDVDRWLADEPVLAYPEPWTRTLVRWLTRHRTAVTAGAAAGLVALAGLGTVAAVQTQGRVALAAKNGELQEANRRVVEANAELTAANARVSEANEALSSANAKIGARYGLAVEAIETFHSGVSEDVLLQEPQLKDLRGRLLDSASGFYLRLGALLEGDADRESRRALLRANFEVAGLADQVGRPEDALAMHRLVLAGREALAAEGRPDPSEAADLARSHVAVGRLLEATGQTDEALASFERAAASVASADGGPPADRATRAAFAEAGFRRGRLLAQIGRSDEAITALERARDLQAALADASPGDDDLQADLALSDHSIGNLLSETGQSAEALAAYEAARALRERLTEANPNVPSYRADLAATINNTGLLLSETGKPAEALAAYEAALAIQEDLARAYPTVTRYRYLLAGFHNNVARLLAATGKPAEALAANEAARTLRAELVRANPEVTQYRADLARSHQSIGNLLTDSGKPEEALAAQEAARALREELVRADPDVTQFRADLAYSRVNIGYLLRELGKPAEALAAQEAARALREELVRADPDVTQFRADLADSHSRIGGLLSATGKPAEALAAFEAAQAIYRELAESNPKVTQYRAELAESRENIGLLLCETGKPAEAMAAFAVARAICQEMADADPDGIEQRARLAACMTHSSVAFRRLGRPGEAREACDRAVAICEALVAEIPDVSRYRDLLAEALLDRGLARRALGVPAGAADDARRALVLWDAQPSRSGEDWFEAASAHATLAGLAGVPGSGVPAEAASGEAGEAIALLRRAVAMGERSPDAFRTEDALDPLRGRDDFRLLRLDLAFPAEAFTR